MRSRTRLAINQREVMAEPLETDTADPELPHQDRFAVTFEADDVDESAAELVDAYGWTGPAPSCRPSSPDGRFRAPLTGVRVRCPKQRPVRPTRFRPGPP